MNLGLSMRSRLISIQDILDREWADNFSPMWIKITAKDHDKKWHLAIVTPGQSDHEQMLYFPQSRISIAPWNVHVYRRHVITMWNFLGLGVRLVEDLAPKDKCAFWNENKRASIWIEYIRAISPIITEAALNEPERDHKDRNFDPSVPFGFDPEAL